MGIDAAILRAMLKAGCSAEQIVSVAEDAAVAAAEGMAAKRAKDAERKRRSRAASSMSRGHSVTDADDCGQGVTPQDPSPEAKRKVSPCTPSKEKTQPSTIPPDLSDERSTPPPIDDIDLTEAVAVFNSTAADAGWSKVQSLNPTRRASLKARLRDCGGIDGWRDAMARARASPFLTGEGGREWRADFDFFMKASKFTKLMEGAYDRRDGSKRDAFRGADRRPSGADQAISALVAAVARRTGGGVPPDDPGGFRFDRGPEDDSGNAGGAAGAAPRLGYGG